MSQIELGSKQFKEFPQLAGSLGLNLVYGIVTDPDVLTLFTAGMLLRSRSRALQGLGVGLGGFYITRRADQYVSVLAHLIGEGEPQGGTNG